MENENENVNVSEPWWCPECEGASVLLGTLGWRLHYRCRCCGTEFSVLAPKKEKDK